MKFFLTSLLCCVLGLVNAQDCNLNITVPDDVTLCDPGYVQLNGSIDGSYFGFEWSGSNGYYNNLTLNSQVWVDQTTTFTLKAYGQAEDNLIQNPSFEDGNTGFSTQYTYNPVSLISEGTYTVTNNPNLVHGGFTACTAHEGNQMLVLNGSVNLSQLWCQTITVMPNTTYVFWAWSTSVNPSNPARLQFSINNVLVGPQLNLSGVLCQWQQFYTIWNSGNETTAQICIVNQNTNPSGNDFALDDLFFGPLCETEESFTVFVETFDILPDLIAPITCFDPEQVITAQTDPAMTGLEYAWETGNGLILSDPGLQEIYVGSAGTYVVTVTSANQCTRTMTFEVEEDNLPPELGIYGNRFLNCNELTTYLEAYTFGNTQADYEWQLPDQTRLRSPGFYVTSPGWYRVTATAPNGCEDIDSVEVVLQNGSFQYTKTLMNPLTCSRERTAVIFENLSGIDSLIWYQDSFRKSFPLIDTVWVNQPGMYYFTFKEGKYCTVTDSLYIPVLPPLHQYQLPQPDTLTCSEPETNLWLLNTEHIEGVEWFFRDTLLSRQDTVIVREPGTYNLVLIDTNGCIKTDSFLVFANKKIPDVMVMVDSIDCKDNEGGFITTSSGNLSWLWSGPSDQSVDSNPRFTREGDYLLTVTGENGCQFTDSLKLPSSRDYPSISVEIQHVTCSSPEGHIRILTGIPADIHWTSPDGNTGRSNLIQSSIPGTYIISAETPQGCTDEELVLLLSDTLSPVLQMKHLDTISCLKPFVTADVNAQGFDSVQWTSQSIAFSQELTPVFTEPGHYTLTLIGNNGCRTTGILQIYADTLVPAFEAEIPDLSCASPVSRLVLSDSTSYTYTMGGQAVQSGFEIRDPGTYVIQATGSNGCSDTALVKVNGFFDSHEMQVDSVYLSCRQPSVLARDKHFVDSVKYTWVLPYGNRIADSLVLVRGNNPVFLEAVNGYGCVSRIEVPVAEDFHVPGLLLEGNPELDCHSLKTRLEARSPDADAVFFWSGLDFIDLQRSQVEISKAGWYQVVAESSRNGCRDTIKFEVFPEQKPEYVGFDLEIPVCAEDPARITVHSVTGGQGPYTIQVNQVRIQTNQEYFLPGPQTYTLQVLDALACSLDTVFMLEARQPLVVDAGKDTTVFYGESVTLKPAASVSWDRLASIAWTPSDDLDCDQCPYPTLEAVSGRLLYLFLTDSAGCTKYDSVWVRVRRLNGFQAPNVIQPSSSGNNRFTIYSVHQSIDVIEDLKIYDRWGNLMFETNGLEPGVPENGWDGMFHNQPGASGVYLWIARIRYKTGEYELASGDLLIAN